jgi:TRAP-type mannitol/chloroaromatic compound transport system permease small subunit
VVLGALLHEFGTLNEISAAPGGLPYRWFLKSFLVTAFVLLALGGLGRLTRVWAALFGRR